MTFIISWALIHVICNISGSNLEPQCLVNANVVQIYDQKQECERAISASHSGNLICVQSAKITNPPETRRQP